MRSSRKIKTGQIESDGSGTDLSYTASPAGGTVVSSNGTDTLLPLADTTNAGLLSPSDKTILNNTSGTNTGDQDLSIFEISSHKQNNLNPDGTGTKFVTVDAVVIGLAGKVGNIFKSSTVSAPVTGVTINTGIVAYQLPAGTFNTSDVFEIWSRLEKTGVNAVFSQRLYINTTASLTGATLIAISTSTAATQLTGKLKRTFTIEGGYLSGFGFSTSSPTDEVMSTAAISSTSFNVSNTYYLMSSVLPSSAADSIVQREFVIRK